MKLVYFTHSLASCWNHGNAHFLRGVLRELQHAGHEVLAFEPTGAWSLQNLLRDHGDAGLDAFRAAYPDLSSREFGDLSDIEATLDGADAVIVHEWNEPELVASLGRLRRRGGRASRFSSTTPTTAPSATPKRSGVSTSKAMTACSPSAKRSQRSTEAGAGGTASGSGTRRPTQTCSARPNAKARARAWSGSAIGATTSEAPNWKASFSARHGSACLPLDIHGVRYPDARAAHAERHGARYRGWLPNARAPEVFARHLATVHVPRRFYVDLLPGIPTIRVFEALACGIPLLSAPWRDAEELFRPGEDYLVARDEAEMARHMAAIRDDAGLRRTLVANGLAADPRPAQLRAPRGGAARHPAQPGRA